MTLNHCGHLFTTGLCNIATLLCSDGDWKLVVITVASSVGMLPQGGEVFCVDKIGIIPLNHSDEVIGFEVCCV